MTWNTLDVMMALTWLAVVAVIAVYAMLPADTGVPAPADVREADEPLVVRWQDHRFLHAPDCPCKDKTAEKP